MKQRRFYPRQVLRALDGREMLTLSAGEQCALRYFLRRSRKLGQPLFIVKALANLASLANATEEQRRAVLENCNSRIYLSMSKAQEVGGLRVFDGGPATSKALAQALGGTPLQLRPGEGVKLNPFSEQSAA